MPPYSGPVVDPFHIPAPDGNVYFDVLTPPGGLLPLYRVLAAHARTFRTEAASARYPAARAYWNGWRLAFQKGIVDLEGTMRKAAIEAALISEKVAKAEIGSTQVRPDTSKRSHLRDHLYSRRLSVGAVELGAVGLFDEDVLNLSRSGRQASGQRGGSYWEAQEFGTDAHVGREVRGFFMPGRARPDQAQFRTHPEFQATKGPRMTIGRPIEERGFLRTGVEAAWRSRDRRINQAAREVSRLLRAFKASRVPPPPPAPRISRRR